MINLDKKICDCKWQLIKPLVWDDEPKEKHVYKCVSVSYVNLPVQGNLKSHISICDEGDYGFKATIWLMNGGKGITTDCYCRTIEEKLNNNELINCNEDEKKEIQLVIGNLREILSNTTASSESIKQSFEQLQKLLEGKLN